MTLNDLKIKMQSVLSVMYEFTEVDSFYYILIDYKLNLSKMDFLMNPNTIVLEVDVPFFESAIEKLKKEQPIQYIVGETEFYGLPFKVTESTLIPRPETEELIDWIIKDQLEFINDQLLILDIGTGSGCIPISLAKNLPKAKVSAVDISEEALKIAKENADSNKVEVRFIHGDILRHAELDLVSHKDKYDIIVSNPPYVRNLEKQEIKKNVLAHEPHLALFVEDDDALIFYRKITEFALEHLKKDGMLYFEINQYLGKQTVELIRDLGFSTVELRKDMSGNDRMIKARF